MRRVAAVAVVAGMGLGALGVSAGASAHHHRMTRAQGAKQFLALVNPANSALHAFGAAADTWVATTPDSTAVTDAKPALAGLIHVQQKLLTDRWPSGDGADAKTLSEATGAVIGDLQGLAELDMADAKPWAQQLVRDADIASADSNVLRHDLGLPRPKPV